jgi:hypothetical protein
MRGRRWYARAFYKFPPDGDGGAGGGTGGGTGGAGGDDGAAGGDGGDGGEGGTGAKAEKTYKESEVQGVIKKRDDLLKANRKLADEKKRYEEFGTIEEIQAERAELAELRKKGVDTSGKDALLAEQERVKKEAAKQIATITAERDEALVSLHSEMIEARAMTGLAGQTDDVDVLLPHLIKQLKMVKEGTGYVTRVVDAEGNVRTKGLDGAPVTIADAIAEMRENKKFAKNFPAPDTSGSGGRANGGRQSEGGVDVWLSAEDFRIPEKYRAAKALAAKRGGSVKKRPE